MAMTVTSLHRSVWYSPGPLSSPASGWEGQFCALEAHELELALLRGGVIKAADQHLVVGRGFAEITTIKLLFWWIRVKQPERFQSLMLKVSTPRPKLLWVRLRLAVLNASRRWKKWSSLKHVCRSGCGSLQRDVTLEALVCHRDGYRNR